MCCFYSGPCLLPFLMWWSDDLSVCVCGCQCVSHTVPNVSVFVLRSTCHGWGRSACRTSMSVSRSKPGSEERRYSPPPQPRSTSNVSFRLSLTSTLPALVLCVFQYDSDGSDSQESSEEAELRMKKIEAWKVSQCQMSHLLRAMIMRRVF